MIWWFSNYVRGVQFLFFQTKKWFDTKVYRTDRLRDPEMTGTDANKPISLQFDCRTAIASWSCKKKLKIH